MEEPSVPRSAAVEGINSQEHKGEARPRRHAHERESALAGAHTLIASFDCQSLIQTFHGRSQDVTLRSAQAAARLSPLGGTATARTSPGRSSIQLSRLGIPPLIYGPDSPKLHPPNDKNDSQEINRFQETVACQSTRVCGGKGGWFAHETCTRAKNVSTR
jgi:hypothetical protein